MIHLSRAAVIGAALAAVTFAQPASAAKLDFLGYTDNVSGETAVDGIINPLFDATYMPIATTALGFSGSAALGITGAAPYAYLDSNSAGAGVCKVLTSTNQCTPSNDDNLTAGEILEVSWSQSLILNSVEFRGEGHPNDPSFGANDLFDYSFDGTTWLTLALVNAKDGVVNLGDVVSDKLYFAFNNEQYYVSALNVSAVPIPAALPLFAGGLGGLGMMGWWRRRKAATC